MNSYNHNAAWNDFNDAEDQREYALIPPKTLAKVIMAIRPGGYDDPSQGWTGGYATRSDKTGAIYLNAKFTILEGPFAKRVVFGLIGLSSPKGPEWTNIGRSFLRAILNSARGIHPADNSPQAQSARRIKGFADLKKVADDIQARKAELGVDGAFTSAGMDSSSDWRFKTHLANLPIYYEYKADGIGSTDAIKGTYLDNYKQIWDLYITDSTCDPKLLASKTGNDAVAEFVGKKAVFYQNGTWAYNDVKDLGDDNLGMLPIYIGVDGEENQGLCTGSENFWCVNNNSSDADIQATLDFLYWCVTSEAGTSAMADKMGFVIPFKKAKDSTNPLITIANQYVADGKTSVDWCFSTMPSEEWKNGVGSALTAYAAGTGKWDDVVTAFVDGWAKEYKLANG